MSQNLRPKCSDCGRVSELVSGLDVYPNRPDLADISLYRCPYCPDSYIGCHTGTTQAIGKPGGPETRQARKAAREVFDPLWKLKAERSNVRAGKAKQQGYAWLAAQLSIAPDDCDINRMDSDTALRAAEICGRFRR